MSCSTSGDAPGGKLTKHFNGSLFATTDGGAFSIEVMLDDKEYDIGKDTIGIVVHNKHDRDISGAALTITHTEIATGRAAPAPTEIEDKQNGLYIISGLDLMREGVWRLDVGVKTGRAEDSVSFILPKAIKERRPKGKY